MEGSNDPKFWEEKIASNQQHHESYSESDDNEIEFQIKRHVEDHLTTYSPPFWTRIPEKIQASPLPPHDHNNGCLSPTSRLRVILDGRKELMEIIKNMPESSYELSLKYLIDIEKNKEAVEEKEVIFVQEESSMLKTETRIPQNGKNKGNKICRSESMESEVFLLKMYLPGFLSFKKKTKSRKNSKILPRPLLEKQGREDWWKNIFLGVNDSRNSISRGKSEVSSKKSRLMESTLIFCGWPFSYKKQRQEDKMAAYIE